MNFDIRYHIWNVFEISRAQGIGNLQEALEMLLTNIELGTCRYKGATQINYFDCMKKICKTPKEKRPDQRKLFSKCMERCSTGLFKAWKDQDREAFEKICLQDIINYKSATERR